MVFFDVKEKFVNKSLTINQKSWLQIYNVESLQSIYSQNY